MDIYNLFKRELKKDWYIQGFNANSIFLNSSARSGFTMKKVLGFGYNSFIFNYKDGYGEMWYLNSDLERIWKIIKSKLEKNPNYLKQVYKKYKKIFDRDDKFFKKLDKTILSKTKNEDLLDMFKKCSEAETDAVGIAHLIDPIGLGMDQELKKELAKFISDKKEFNRVYTILTTPDELSFITQEEKELKALSNPPSKEQNKKLEQHLKKYFWIQNSYAGPKSLNLSFFKKRVEMIKNIKKKQVIYKSKIDLIKKLKLTKKIQGMVKIINFTTIWQDQRKANVLKTVGYFGMIINEINKRIKIKKDLLNNLCYTDIFKFNSLKEINKLKNELITRSKGMFILMKNNKELIVTGKKYNNLVTYRQKLTEITNGDENEIHGSIANGGTVIGRVTICKGVNSISKVKKGDILVTSMTRPEYMPAIKKASAIVTDEGGITCHAAIVARELNIPAVIGTKIATKILKDNMMVQVKANHGLVKIIKQ